MIQIIYYAAVVYTLIHLSIFLYKKGIETKKRKNDNWLSIYNQKLSYKLNRTKIPFMIIKFINDSFVREKIIEETKKDVEEPLSPRLIEHLSTRYGKKLNKSTSIINFIYELKFSKYYDNQIKKINEFKHKKRHKSLYNELIKVRDITLEKNLQSIIRVVQINLEKGYFSEDERQIWKNFLYENGRKINEEAIKNEYEEEKRQFQDESLFNKIKVQSKGKENEKVNDEKENEKNLKDLKNNDSFEPKKEKNSEVFEKENDEVFERKIKSSRRKIDREDNISFKKEEKNKRKQETNNKIIQHRLF